MSYEPPLSMTLGSKAREKDLRYKLKTKLKRWQPLSKSDNGQAISARFACTDIEKIKAAISDLDRMLDAIARERLPPKIVEEILGITARERVRWSKDGRLPKSGTGSFRKGQHLLRFYLHPVEEIAKLAANPTIIAEWREVDRKAARKTHHD